MTVITRSPISVVSANLTIALALAMGTVGSAAATDKTTSSSTTSAEQQAYAFVEIMPPVQVSASQRIAQQTPIANRNGNVYIVNTEPGDTGDLNGVDLHTVIRQGSAGADGQWVWTKNIVNSNTIFDPWHTPPAVGIDQSGYVHVAYNMHNFPWQYARANQPDSIGEFTFLGDEMSLKEIKKAKFENKTSFRTMGYAAIPGNQVTYPAFYQDPAGSLYVTYRFAAKPARPYKSRTMSAGVAKYDAGSEQWRSLGGDLNSEKSDYKTSWFKTPVEPRAIASQTGWTTYHPRLTFDENGKLYAYFFWREGVAGETLVKPCIITSTDLQQFTALDGTQLELPLKSQDCGNIDIEADPGAEYNTIGSITATPDGTIHIVISPTDQPRKLLTYSEGKWSSEESPYGATEIFVDNQNNLWAVATGLKISRKLAGQSDWKTIIRAEENTLCYPKVSLNDTKNTAFVYSQSCNDANTVSVHSLNLGTNPNP